MSAGATSPCVGVCELDAERTCVGCGRTIAEIAAWSGMSEDERRAACAAIAARRAGREAGR